MTLSASTRPVVVCVDGSPAGTQAVRWAVDEADRRKTRLCVIHVSDPAVARPREDPLPAAHRLAHQLGPKVDIVTEQCVGVVAEVLLERSKHARLLVAGSRGVGRPIEALPNSTEAVLAMHAHCPVIIVPDDVASAAQRAHAPVVVGVDGSPLSESALEFAFDSAASRGVALVAVHTWGDVVPPREGHGARQSPGVDVIQHEEQRVLAERLAGWAEKYPEVDTQRLVVQDRPVHALLEQAEVAQLLVVGSRGRGGFAGLLLGSTSNALLYCSPCPLAIVRHEAR
jgi:nucleotide-binding universal stress UspA family protein